MALAPDVFEHCLLSHGRGIQVDSGVVLGAFLEGEPVV